jgi:short-subunit dehydrogenase
MVKTILITGASSGIGAALAKHYAAEGKNLFLGGRDAERLKAIAESCERRGAVVQSKVLDVTNQSAMTEWIEACDALHSLDLVIANAGISGGTGGNPVAGELVSQARKIFDVNVMGVLNTIEPILPRMMERGTGQIAIMASLAGFAALSGAPAYSASKSAVRVYGEALRGAVKHTGVKINVICPGFIESRMTDANDFPMPLMMTAERAAGIMADGISKNKGRIAFPWVMYAAVGAMGLLPFGILEKCNALLPKKQTLTITEK